MYPLKFTGELLSLNFQDIEVGAVLQIIADFTGLNVVVSDTVQGNLTLRLQNVPWDQALDMILRTKGLTMRQNGNVIYIAPAEEISEEGLSDEEAFLKKIRDAQKAQAQAAGLDNPFLMKREADFAIHLRSLLVPRHRRDLQ